MGWCGGGLVFSGVDGNDGDVGIGGRVWGEWVVSMGRRWAWNGFIVFFHTGVVLLRSFRLLSRCELLIMPSVKRACSCDVDG